MMAAIPLSLSFARARTTDLVRGANSSQSQPSCPFVLLGRLMYHLFAIHGHHGQCPLEPKHTEQVLTFLLNYTGILEHAGCIFGEQVIGTFSIQSTYQFRTD